jgi:hypothetical protein
MIIPNAEHAFIDIRKLRDYTLNAQHRVGRHKARLFASIVGITQEDVGALRDILLAVVRTHEAELGEKDAHGQRYELDFMMRWQEQQALVRSVWNIRPNEQHPRFVTCYPLKERQT